MSADSLTHLSEAKRIIPLTDLQPPVEPLLWRGLIAITGHVSSMLLFQLALLWSALALLSVYVYKVTTSRKLSLVPLLIGLLPVVINISGVIWSDNQMAFSLLLALALILFIPKLKTAKLKYPVFLLAILLIIYACLSRYNAFFAVIPLIILAVVQSGLFGGRRKQIFAVLACALMLIGSIGLIKFLANAEHRSSTSGFMLDDIVHSASYDSIEQANLPPPLKVTLLEIKACAAEKNVVIDSFWNCTNLTDRQNLLILYVKELRTFWESTLLHFPVHYGLYKIEAFTLVLFPSPGKQYVWQWGIDPHILNLKPKYQSLGNVIQMYTLNFGYKHFSFLYEPWFWLVAHILILWKAAQLTYYRRFVVALSASSLLYILGFVPTGVAVDYRYIYWPVLAGLVSLLLFVVDKHSIAPKMRTAGRHLAKS